MLNITTETITTTVDSTSSCRSGQVHRRISAATSAKNVLLLVIASCNLLIRHLLYAKINGYGMSRSSTRPAYLAGQEGIEPPTPGFGDRCSAKLSYWPTPAQIPDRGYPPVDTLPRLNCRLPVRRLFHFLVQSVLPVEPAVLLLLHPLRHGPLIPRCRVVAPLALGASQCRQLSGHYTTSVRSKRRGTQ